MRLAEEFWNCIDRSGGPDACWLWLAGKISTGYGSLFFRSRPWTSHRLAYFLTHGAIPGPVVMHTCDVRVCCNPAHLRAGTYQENSADMVSKGRHRIPNQRGEKRYNAKISNAGVLAIARRIVDGESRKDIAADFGVSRQTISAIATGRNWGHMTGFNVSCPIKKRGPYGQHHPDGSDSSD